MQMDSQLVTLESELKNFNKVKGIILERLFRDKIITEEQAKEYLEKWNVIIFKPSWFSKWKSVFCKDTDEYQINFVKFSD